MQAPSSSRPLRVVTSMATADLVTALLERAGRVGPGCEVDSMGGVAAAEKLRAGEPYDVAVLSADSLASLAADGVVIAETQAAVAESEVMVATPAGAPTPDLSDAQCVWEAIRDAEAVGYSTGPSGTALVRLIDHWGGRTQMRGELLQAPPGIPVATLLAERAVSLGFQQASELAGKPGIDVVGALPDDCAIRTTFSAAVVAGTTRTDDAAQVVAELRAPQSAELVVAHHMTPVSADEQ